MLGNPAKIKAILNAASAYRVPPYQRAYQWEINRWHGLVHDVIEASTKSDTDPPHWLGILLLSEESTTSYFEDDSIRLFTVIDGQQRLTTTMLWLAAIAHHAKDIKMPMALDVTKFARLEVQEFDKTPFRVAIDGKWRQAKYSSLLDRRPLRAYAYFRWLLWLGEEALLEEEPVKLRQLKPVAEEGSFEEQWRRFRTTKQGASIPGGTPVDLTKLETATRQKMSVFTLIHDPKTDESQATIFDTLNGMRTPLEPLDHVRNSLFIRLPEDRATILYERHWKDAEDALRSVRMGRMSAEKTFLYDYLISKGEKKRQKTLNADRGAAQFSVMSKGKVGDDLEELILDDLVPSMAAWPVVVRRTNECSVNGVKYSFSTQTTQRMTTIYELSQNPANPIVLHFCTAHVRGDIPETDLIAALSYAEAYIARQILAGRPLSPLRTKVMDIMALIDGSFDAAHLKMALVKSDWPGNEEILESATTRPIYTEVAPRVLLALFRGIERARSGNGAMFFEGGKDKSNYTIEHILPQKPAKWAQDLTDWKADADALTHLTHAIGNLAVVTLEHNSSVGNGTFSDKKSYPTKAGKAAPLQLNNDWLNASKWTETEILGRGNQLVAHGLNQWSLK